MLIRSAKRKVTVLTVFVAVFISVFSAGITANAFNDSFSDTHNHWAETDIEEWAEKGLVKGGGDDNFSPDAAITRAEFITLINRAFRNIEKSNVQFSDVKPSSWYEDEIAKGYAAGFIAGYGGGIIMPENSITRAEAAVMLFRILKLDFNGEDVFDYFNDASEIPAWAREAVGAVAAGGYMNGDAAGDFHPNDPATRAEAVAILSRGIGELYNEAGTYGPEESSVNIGGNLTVNTDGVKLQNMVIEGNLYLAAGIGDGAVELERITVKGKTVISGGGEHSVVINNSTLGEVVVVRIGGVVRVVAAGDTSIGQVILETVAALKEEGLIGAGFKDVDIQANVVESGESIVLDGEFDNVTLNAAARVDITGDTTVRNFSVTEKGGNSTVNVGADASIGSLVLGGKSTITGTGAIGTIKNNSESEIDDDIKQGGSSTGGGPAPDTTPPAVTGFSPADDGTLEAGENLVLTFGKTVKAAAGKNITIRKTADGTIFAVIPVNDAKITISANTVTINPENNFDYSTSYYVEIDTGAFKDDAGNGYAGISGKTTWNFTSLPPEPSLMVGGHITEGAENGEIISTAVLNDTYTADIVNCVTVDNLPQGVEVSDIECHNGSFINIHLTGNSNEDYDSDITVAVHIAPEGLNRNIGLSGDFTFTAVDESPLTAPSEAVADDVNDTINWRCNANQNEAGDYEYSTNGGETWSTCTAKPQTGIIGDIAAGMVRLRTKATLREPASSALFFYNTFSQTTIESKFPADGQQNIPMNAGLTLTFYETVTAVPDKMIYIVLCDSTDIGHVYDEMEATDPQVAVSGKTVTIQPDPILDSGGHYYIIAEPGAFVDALGRDSEGIGTNVIYGKSDLNDYMWDFYTLEQTIGYSGTAFFEADSNDGSVTDTVTATLLNETFTAGPYEEGTDEFDGDYYVSGLPEGLTVAINRVNDTQVIISLTDNALNHDTGETEFFIHFNNSMFTGGDGNALDGNDEMFTVAFVDRFSSIDPVSAEFDKANPADIQISMDQNDNVFFGLESGETELIRNTNYFVTPDDENTDTVTIRSGYLSSLDNGDADITFCFVGGHNLTLSLSIIDTEDHAGPTVTGYEPEPGVTEVAINDFNVECLRLTFNENIVLVPGKEIEIVDADDAGGSITLSADDGAVSVDGKTLELFINLEYGTHYYVRIDEGAFTDVMGNDFAGISSDEWSFTTEGYIEPAQLNPSAAIFDKNELFRDDIDVTVTLNEAEALIGLKNGDADLVEGTSYTVSGSVVTIKQDYMMGLDNGNYAVKFDMQAGNDPVLVLTVKETVAPIAISLLPKDGTKDVATDTTLTIEFDKPVVPVQGLNISIIYYENINVIESMYYVESIDAANESKVCVNNNIVTITPENELPYNGKYFVVVEEGAFKDTSGNEFAGTGYFMWKFETLRKSMTLDGTEFIETDTNDGSIENTITATLTNETFSGGPYVQGATQNDGDFYVQNIPEDLTVAITDIPDSNGSQVEIALTGNALVHDESGTTYSLYIEFHDSMFTGGSNALIMPDGLYSVTFISRLSSIEPDTADFDKASPADIVISMDQNQNGFAGLKNGQDDLEEGNDYTVNAAGDEVTIKSEYVASLDDGAAHITFCFIGGSDLTLIIDIENTNDTTGPVATAFTPANGTTDFQVSGLLTFSITFNENLFNNDGVSPDIKIIRKQDDTAACIVDKMFMSIVGKTARFYAAGLDYGTEYYITIGEGSFCDLKGNPYTGISNPGTWCFTTDVEPARISPTSAEFDKNVLYSDDITVTITLNDAQSLVGLKNGETALEAGTDYTVSGNTVTISEDYLMDLPTGSAEITFDMQAGRDPVLTVNIDATVGDQRAPVLLSLSPEDGATDVSTDQALVITFDEPVYPGEGGQGIILYKTNDAGDIISGIQLLQTDAAVQYDETNCTVTINPDFLEGYSCYAVFIDADTFVDQSGNAFPGMGYDDSDGYMWNFKTQFVCPVDWCRFQWPNSATVNDEDSLDVYARVYHAGITDISEYVDEDPYLMGQFGYGPAGSDPSSDDGWVWVDATPNMEYIGEFDESFLDEYTATLTLTEPGCYDMCVRFTLDNGNSWLYGDLDGSDNGYDANQAASLTVLAN